MSCRRWVGMILALALLTACGIDGDLKQAAKARQKAWTEARTKIESARDKYMAWKGTPEYERFARYETAYDWPGQYAAALAKLDSAKPIYDEVERILDANRPEDERVLANKMLQLKGRIVEARDMARKPNQEIGELRDLMADAPKFIDKAETQVKAMEAILANARPLAESAMADSKSYGWDKEADIAQRVGNLEEILAAATTAFETAKVQNMAQDTDYAVIDRSLQRVEKERAAMEKTGKTVEQHLGELKRSYTKRLIDMKHVYTVQIGRTSWDNYYDYPRETNYLYSPRAVDEATYQYLAKQSGDIASGLYRPRPNISNAMWQALKINGGERAPKGDDDAVFWVNDFEIRYYHRYRIIENGQERETDWQRVDEDFYADNIENLGMDILSKPYGMYASEAMQAATPPAMAYVGNSQYGRWRQDSTGNRFWEFYGRYAFLNAMLGGNRYYYNDWDRWRRDYRGREPYYGSNTDGSTVYGTRGSVVRRDPNYRSTTFARRGGIKAAPADIRSAAGGVRGRGPGSRGK